MSGLTIKATPGGFAATILTSNEGGDPWTISMALSPQASMGLASYMRKRPLVEDIAYQLIAGLITPFDRAFCELNTIGTASRLENMRKVLDRRDKELKQEYFDILEPPAVALGFSSGIAVKEAILSCVLTPAACDRVWILRVQFSLHATIGYDRLSEIAKDRYKRCLPVYLMSHLSLLDLGLSNFVSPEYSFLQAEGFLLKAVGDTRTLITELNGCFDN